LNLVGKREGNKLYFKINNISRIVRNRRSYIIIDYIKYSIKILKPEGKSKRKNIIIIIKIYKSLLLVGL